MAKTEPKSASKAEPKKVRIDILADNGRTRVEMERHGNVLLFRTIGFIDEDINFSVVIEKVRSLPPEIDTLQFDLGGVVGLNSCGVREWIILMERLPVGTKRVFTKVSGVFIEQTNMVPSMLGKGAWKMLSFSAPYHCAKCDADHQALLEPSAVKFVDGKPVAPAVSCPMCSSPMAFDWIEDEYFSFLAREAG